MNNIYLVYKYKDIKDYLTLEQEGQLIAMTNAIRVGRKVDNKPCDKHYKVSEVDDEYNN